MKKKIREIFRGERWANKVLFGTVVLILVAAMGLVAAGVVNPRNRGPSSAGYYPRNTGTSGYGQSGYFVSGISGYYTRPPLIDVFRQGTGAGNYPNGTLVRVIGTPGVYLIEEGHRRGVISPTAFESWGFRWGDILPVTQPELDKYPSGANVLARPGTLLRGDTDTTVYIVDFDSAGASGNKKRGIASATVFNLLGLKWSEIKGVPLSELEFYVTGTVITNALQRPDGSLIRGSGSTVYLVDEISDQIGRFYSPISFTSWGYSWGNVISVTDVEIYFYTTFYTNSTILAAPGTLLRGSGAAVYVTDYLGDTVSSYRYKKRGIPNPIVFNAKGYNWANVNNVSDTELAQYVTETQVGN